MGSTHAQDSRAADSSRPPRDGVLLPAVPHGRRRRRPDADQDDGVTRRRAGEAKATGMFERPQGPFRLAAGLSAPGALPLQEAVDLVTADWLRQLRENKISPSTYRKAEPGIRRFATYARGHGVHDLDGVTAAVVQAYCDARNAPAASGSASTVVGLAPSGATKVSRRSHVRAFFNTCNALGLDDRDPTTRVVVPHRQGERFVRPLTDAEFALCRHRSRKQVGETRLPAAVALASRNATTAELPVIRVRDLHLDAAKVWLHGGGTRTEARWADLDDWSVDALARRVAELAESLPADALPDSPVVYVSRKGDAGTDKGTSRQSAAAVTLGRVFELAGLADVPGIRPTSFTEHAAVRIWKETGRLEAVAAALGIRGLDTTAELLRLDWRDKWRVAAPDGVDDPDTPVTYAGTAVPPVQRAEP